MIKDGTGKGYIAKVDGENRLWVYSTTRSEIAFQSEYNERSYMSYGRRNFAAGGVDEGIIHFTYTGAGSCHVSQIIFSSNSALAKIEMFVDSVYVSGGVLRPALNINRVSGNTSETSIYIGSSNLSTTDDPEKEILDVRLSANGGTSTFKVDFMGGLILGTNDTFSLVGEVANAGDKIRASVYYYEETDQ